MILVERRSGSTTRWQRLLGRFFHRRTADVLDGEPALAAADLALARSEQATPGWIERGVPAALAQAHEHRPLASGDPCFVGRADELGRIAHGLTAWRDGRPMLLAVTSPAGCGLTSLLNQVPTLLEPSERCTQAALSGRPDSQTQALALCAQWFDLPQVPESIDDAVATLLDQPAHVVVIDDGHFLYARILGGNEGILALNSLMVATQGRHLWVLGCEQQSWRRQCHTRQAHRYVDEVIELQPFSAPELAELLDRRLGPMRDVTHSDPAQAAALSWPVAFVQGLHQVTQGHPGLSFFHLLRSLRHLDGERYALDDAAELDLVTLRELSRTELLTLAEVSAHGMLDATDHIALFRLDAQASAVMLHHLQQLGLIDAVARPRQTPRYRLQPLHAASINAFLVRANYLY